MLGAEHPATVDTMGNFANFLQETSRFEKAESLHRRALDIRRRVQGEKAPSTVSEINDLANDLASLSRFEEAKTLQERTLQLKMELYGEAHPSTLNSVANRARRSEQPMGHPANAEPLHRRALDGRMRALGAAHSAPSSPGNVWPTLCRTWIVLRKRSASRRLPQPKRRRASANGD